MGVIYERQHSTKGGRIIIHDDCLPRTESQRQARQREVQRAVIRALEGMVARHGPEDAARMLAESPHNPANWTAEEIARYEEVQRARLAWWDAMIDQNTNGKETGK